MTNKLKNLFKISRWKRIFILSFLFISIGLFIGLSFGFYSKKNSPTINYKDGIQLSVKPTNPDSTTIDDEAYLNQIFYNLSMRLNQEFPDNNLDIQREQNGVINIKSTNINSIDKKNHFIDVLTKKEKLTVVTINDVSGNSFYSGDVNLLFSGVTQLSNNSYSLLFNNSFDSMNLWKEAKRFDDKVENILVWKNFEIFKKIVEADIKNDVDNINNAEYGGSYYAYLFKDGRTPEKIKDHENGLKAILKDNFEFEGKKYNVSDFLISKNSIDDIKGTTQLEIKKNFDATNWKIDSSKTTKEYVAIRYWLSSYQLNNYLASFIEPENGSHAYTFLIIALVSVFAILSIFIVINYGYLGMIALLLLSVIVFLSLLVTVTFVGDYDMTTVLALMLSLFISADIIVLFFEKIKREVKKGNSIPKAIKNSAKLTNKTDYIKSLILIVVFSVVYIFISRIYGTFALIVLSTIVFIPIIMILLLRLLIYVFIGLKKFENNGKTIGFWKSNFLIKKNSETNNENYLIEQLKLEEKNELSLQKSSKYKLFLRLNKNGVLISLLTLFYLIVGGLIVFLVSWFITGNGYNINRNDQEQTVLRIGKNNSEQDNLTNYDVANIKKDLISNGIKSSQIYVTKSNLIEVYIYKDYEASKINQISSTLISKYNVTIIQSQLRNSHTFYIMQFTMYSIFTAIVLICLFVLFWMNWTKAITFLIMGLLFVVCFITMLMFGFVTLSVHISTVLLFVFVLFVLNQLNSFIRYNEKLKSRRIEELDKLSIKNLIDRVTFGNLKSTLIINGITVLSFIIFTLFIGSLPAIPLLIISLVIVNLVFNIFLLPKLLIWFESIRVRSIRKRILNNYWETEKIKEQVFSGINNIK